MFHSLMNISKESFKVVHHFELFYLCLNNFVIFYKMAISWLYMYEGIDKVTNIHTPILDGTACVLQPKV
jgi:hypothetical protein